MTFVLILQILFTARNLSSSPAKTAARLITAWTSRVKNQKVTFDSAEIQTVNYPKILSAILDASGYVKRASHSYLQQDEMQEQGHKVVVGSTCGMDKETFLATYEAIGRYAFPLWSTIVIDLQWKIIYASQNAVLGTMTGCHTMPSVDRLHERTKVLPVRRHKFILSRQ